MPGGKFAPRASRISIAAFDRDDHRRREPRVHRDLAARTAARAVDLREHRRLGAGAAVLVRAIPFDDLDGAPREPALHLVEGAVEHVEVREAVAGLGIRRRRGARPSSSGGRRAGRGTAAARPRSRGRRSRRRRAASAPRSRAFPGRGTRTGADRRPGAPGRGGGGRSGTGPGDSSWPCREAKQNESELARPRLGSLGPAPSPV